MPQRKKTTILSEKKRCRATGTVRHCCRNTKYLKTQRACLQERTHSIHHSNPVKTGLYKDLYVKVYNTIIINAKPQNNPNAL